MPETIFRYFPLLSDNQKERISRLKFVYDKWNSRINVISRRDMDNFFTHHVLHSLSIAKVINFAPGTHVLDVGTGGGFPGIPLAILFPDSAFTLLDSIGKKIRVVTAVAGELELENVHPLRKRVEDEEGSYDFVVSRAVMEFPGLVKLTSQNLLGPGKNTLENGILCLKGGDLQQELKGYRNRVNIWDLSDFFTESFFKTKKIVYLPFRNL